MIDHLDKQTKPLPLEQKRGRGRPATGKALSNAERQRTYRERQKAKSTCISPATTEEIKRLQDEIIRLREALVETETAGLKRIGELRAENKKLKEQLSSRDEKPVRGLSYRKLTEDTLDQLKIIEKSADTKTARNWSFGAYLLWQRVVLTMNVQRATREADEEKMRAIIGLDPRDPK